jgi:deoxyribodipyrimidine photolyase-related protein
MNNILIILPNQLYVPKNEFNKYYKVYIIEEPIYFYDKIYKPYKPNKVKLAFLRASMKYYYDTNYKSCKNVNYISYNNIQKFYDTLSEKSIKINMYDPIDFDLIDKYNKCIQNKIEILDSPDLLIDKDTLYSKYFKSHDNTQRHASFYEFVKSELNILHNIKNLDKLNRSPPPKDEPYVYNFQLKKGTEKYYNEAIEYVNTHFSDHIGKVENVKVYPITTQDAIKSFNNFLNNALANFGKYEDAVMKNDPFMYHSIISPLLNNGLLNPKQVIDKTLIFYSLQKSEIPLSSLEGFIRQIVGWRCMMQGMYIFKYNDMLSMNTPNNQYRFKDYKIWYTGNTGILPLDEEIKKAHDYGYSHHIVRLMIFMNFFILCEVHPLEIYKWFMEVVSIDAYSWVMISNIYAMGYFYPKLMTKPYLSTSGYIVKMSNYKKNGNWDKIWDALYHDFISKKDSKYTFFYKRTARLTPELEKIATEFKKKHFVLIK